MPTPGVYSESYAAGVSYTRKAKVKRAVPVIISLLLYFELKAWVAGKLGNQENQPLSNIGLVYSAKDFQIQMPINDRAPG